MTGEAKNVKAMREWIQQNRPDVMGTFESIAGSADSRSTGQAIFALMCMAFEAGRQHQKHTPDDSDLAPIRKGTGVL